MENGVQEDYAMIHFARLRVTNIKTRRNKNQPIGTNRIAQGSDPHMQDVCRLSIQAWDHVSESAIARCWKKLKCQSVLHEAHLSNSHGKPPRIKDNSSTVDSFELFRKLEIKDSIGNEQREEAGSYVPISLSNGYASKLARKGNFP